jgi:outer membrane protein assembly factor BamC
MRFLQLSPLFMLDLLAGCGSMSLENKRVDYKSTAASVVPPLEVPPDLTAPATGDQYAIPAANSESASYSDFAKNGAPQAIRSAAVLPESRKVRLMHSGSRRWLLVNDKAENLWPLIKGFWQENGFVIKTENQQAGIIETDWAENRENIPKTGLRQIFGRVFDNLYDSGTRDMYRTRIERTEDGKGTEIYVTQYGMEQVLTEDKKDFKWEPRPNDPDLEAATIQMLMAKLSGADAANQNGKSAGAAASAPESASPVKLLTQPDGSKVIVLGEPFDRSWRRVGIALDHADVVVEDKDRTKGLYFLRVDVVHQKKGWSKLAFWQKSEGSESLHYQVFVHESGKNCEVGAHNGEGGNDATTQSIVDQLYSDLSKQ